MFEYVVRRGDPTIAGYNPGDDLKGNADGAANFQSLIRDSRMAEPAKRKSKSKSRSPERAEFVQSGEELPEETSQQMEEDKGSFQSAYDDRVVPALLKKRQGGEQSQMADEEEPPAKKEQAEPLSETTLIQAEPYKPVFAMPLLELLFSRHCYLRDEGLDIINQEITSKSYSKLISTDPEKILNAIIGIVVQLIQGKILTLGTKSLNLLLQALTVYKVDRKASILNPSTIEYMLDGLFDRLGEGNSLLNVKIEETLLGMIKQSAIGINTLLSQLIKNSKKTQRVVKQVQRRLGLVAQILKKFDNEVKEVQMEDIVEYALSGVRHTNRDIRLAGYGILVEIYRITGDKIDTYLEDLMPVQRKALDEELKKAFGAKAGLKQVEVKKEEKPKEEAKAKKDPKPKKEEKKAIPKEEVKKPKEEAKKADKPAKKEEAKKSNKDVSKAKSEEKKASPSKRTK